MKREEHRRDLLSVGRTWLWIMDFFFLINLLATIFMGSKGFLFWFNFTCFFGTIVLIGWLDLRKYKIIEGRIWNKKISREATCRWLTARSTEQATVTWGTATIPTTQNTAISIKEARG